METAEHLFAELKARGLRLTPARKAFASVLLRAAKPLSGPEILSKIKKTGLTLNKTTVYRELEQWQALGLLVALRLADRQAYYELASQKHHHHLVCLSCQKVEDVAIDEAGLKRSEALAKKQKQFTVMRHALEF